MTANPEYCHYQGVCEQLKHRQLATPPGTAPRVFPLPDQWLATISTPVLTERELALSRCANTQVDAQPSSAPWALGPRPTIL